MGTIEKPELRDRIELEMEMALIEEAPQTTTGGVRPPAEEAIEEERTPLTQEEVSEMEMSSTEEEKEWRMREEMAARMMMQSPLDMILLDIINDTMEDMIRMYPSA